MDNRFGEGTTLMIRPQWRLAWARELVGLLLIGVLLAPGLALAWQGGQATISSPQPFSTLRGVISINGTATHPSFQRFQLYFRSESVPDEWHFMFEQTNQVSNGLLGTWDTRGVPDGTYALRLRVVRVDGNYDEKEINGLLVANTRPVDTPTPDVTPTLPEPAAPTATPTSIFTPTPVTVQQPQIATPTPRATVVVTATAAISGTLTPRSTPNTGGADTTTASGADSGSLFGSLFNLGQMPSSLSAQGLSDAFLRGARLAVAAFAFLAAYLVLKWLIRWLLTRRQ
jgi:hypothetical protein